MILFHSDYRDIAWYHEISRFLLVSLSKIKVNITSGNGLTINFKRLK